MANDLAAQLAATAHQVQYRMDLGDPVDTPRMVEHFFIVAKRRAMALADDLEAAGFQVAMHSGLFKSTVEGEREDSVDAQSAEAFTRQVVALADKHGANYDGWGGMSLAAPVDGPTDTMDFADVDVPGERSRLRALYASTLEADGCPAALAADLARDVTVEITPDRWVLGDGIATSSNLDGYSPSLAEEEIQEMAASQIEDNQTRRRPKWVSAG